MNDPQTLLVFRLEGRLHGVPLDRVGRVLRAAEVTPLPGAPAAVLGAIDLAGALLPVVSLRSRLGLPERPLAPAHQFLVVQTAAGAVALVVDEVEGLSAPEPAAIASVPLAPGLEAFHGLARLDDGLALIHDVERLLSGEDQRRLATALEAVG
ncbi:MAG TPA: chemotaxis protein CheW [Ramlibacter sp.]|nr:chemotaxis protein CheW [Ramlibacter sp.]